MQRTRRASDVELTQPTNSSEVPEIQESSNSSAFVRGDTKLYHQTAGRAEAPES